MANAEKKDKATLASASKTKSREEVKHSKNAVSAKIILENKKSYFNILGGITMRKYQFFCDFILLFPATKIELLF